MPLGVCHGATLQCSLGTASSILIPTTALPSPIYINNRLIATVFDHKPGQNILPFGLCMATGIPSPCIPVTPNKWIIGVSGVDFTPEATALSMESKLLCVRGGIITIVSCGQSTVFIDKYSGDNQVLLVAQRGRPPRQNAPTQRMTSSQARELAERLGYREVPNQRSHGQPIFTDGRTYITPDVDSHNGGVWKRARSIEDFANRGTRMGTYNADLSVRIGD